MYELLSGSLSGSSALIVQLLVSTTVGLGGGPSVSSHPVTPCPQVPFLPHPEENQLVLGQVRRVYS